MPLAVINAGTTYGLDTSAANNYGLGPAFQSTMTLQSQQVQQQAAPSWLWLFLFVVLVWWLA